MDYEEKLWVRFHFDGTFVSSDGHLQYVGGRSEMSSIELDKLSLPEIRGHFADHVIGSGVLRLHWLKPGKELSDGLMLLVDDGSCKIMADHITDGGVADIYVEGATMESKGGVDAYKVDDEAEHNKDLKSFSSTGLLQNHHKQGVHQQNMLMRC